jgi:hypothetical protein
MCPDNTNELSTEGGWDTDWSTGRQPAPRRAVASPRDLVGLLFEPYRNDSPFTDVRQFLTRQH